MAESKSVTPKALAASLNVDPKALRRFMRKHADRANAEGGAAIVERVGQGNRYDMTPTQAKAIADAFNAQRRTQAPQATKAPKA